MQGPGRNNAYLSVVGEGHNMGVIRCSFNLNISPTVSRGVLECDAVVVQNHMFTIL